MTTASPEFAALVKPNITHPDQQPLDLATAVLDQKVTADLIAQA